MVMQAQVAHYLVIRAKLEGQAGVEKMAVSTRPLFVVSMSTGERGHLMLART